MLISPAGPLLLQRPLVTSTAVRRVWMQSASVCIIYGGPGNPQQVVSLGAGATGSPLWLELPGVVYGGDRLSPLSQAHYTGDQEQNSLNPNSMDERRGGRDEVQCWLCFFSFSATECNFLVWSGGRHGHASAKAHITRMGILWLPTKVGQVPGPIHRK